MDDKNNISRYIYVRLYLQSW